MWPNQYPKFSHIYCLIFYDHVFREGDISLLCIFSAPCSSCPYLGYLSTSVSLLHNVERLNYILLLSNINTDTYLV